MRASDPELLEFLDVLGRVAQRDPGDHAAQDLLTSDPQQGRLAETGALDLGVETADMDDAVQWLVEAVRRTAQHDPALAFSLAGRYVGQRALALLGEGQSADAGATVAVCHAVTSGAVEVTVAERFAPSQLVLIDAGGGELASARLEPDSEQSPARRTGLGAALLRDVEVEWAPAGSPDLARPVHLEWGLLVAAVCVGTAEGAVEISTAYARERQQFDTRLIDFAGLRAVLGEMSVRVAQVRGLLDSALDEVAARPEDGGHSTGPAWGALVASAGRVAVDVCLDAIQVHGGYGYIEEYPVAGLLRDAVSLRARCLPRRAAVGAMVSAGPGSTR